MKKLYEASYKSIQYTGSCPQTITIQAGSFNEAYGKARKSGLKLARKQLDGTVILIGLVETAVIDL